MDQQHQQPSHIQHIPQSNPVQVQTGTPSSDVSVQPNANYSADVASVATSALAELLGRMVDGIPMIQQSNHPDLNQEVGGAGGVVRDEPVHTIEIPTTPAAQVPSTASVGLPSSVPISTSKNTTTTANLTPRGLASSNSANNDGIALMGIQTNQLSQMVASSLGNVENRPVTSQVKGTPSSPLAVNSAQATTAIGTEPKGKGKVGRPRTKPQKEKTEWHYHLGGMRHSRVPLTAEIKEVLEVAYVSRIMSKNFRKEGQPEKERIANITGMDIDKVQEWFKNRRKKDKLQRDRNLNRGLAKPRRRGRSSNSMTQVPVSSNNSLAPMHVADACITMDLHEGEIATSAPQSIVINEQTSVPRSIY